VLVGKEVAPRGGACALPNQESSILFQISVSPSGATSWGIRAKRDELAFLEPTGKNILEIFVLTRRFSDREPSGERTQGGLVAPNSGYKGRQSPWRRLLPRIRLGSLS
jgi:hypothetical protein